MAISPADSGSRTAGMWPMKAVAYLLGGMDGTDADWADHADARAAIEAAEYADWSTTSMRSSAACGIPAAAGSRRLTPSWGLNYREGHVFLNGFILPHRR